VVLEQDQAGGTILQYPRKKVVLTQPVDIPLYGRLERDEYTKEELLAVWEAARERFELPVRAGERITDLARRSDGLLTVRTQNGEWIGRACVLALGRRGTPRKLAVPGEDLPKVAYKLLDAESYRGERVLVVGGGDSAVEAAIGLARQPGNRVTLSYRRDRLFRIKKRNEERFAAALAAGEITALFESEVTEILPDRVRLSLVSPSEPGETPAREPLELPNDHVFVFAGGDPPYPLLRRMGIEFGVAAPAGTTRARS
jgi:thioredoxin reductase